jgi:hypothetical protein
MTREQLMQLVQAAARNPNHRGLLLALAALQKSGQYPLESWLPPYDPELLASLCLAAASGRAAAPEGHGYEWYRVAEAARDLGRPGHVLAAVARFREEPADEEDALRCALWAAEARMQLCDFKRAANEFTALVAWDRFDYEREEATRQAAICAVLAGNDELLQRLAGDPRANVRRSGEFLAACRKYLAGEVGRPDHPSGHGWDVEDVLLAEAELAQGGDFMRPDRPRVWSQWLQRTEAPHDWRLKWVLLERYYRLQPSLPHAAGFYEAAEWQHPDDPYVASAVAAWRKSGGDRSLPSADEVIANVAAKQWSGWQKMPYWTAVARIRRDVEEGRPGDARRLLAAFPAYQRNRYALYAWLARKIEEASPSAPATAKP